MRTGLILKINQSLLNTNLVITDFFLRMCSFEVKGEVSGNIKFGYI